MKKFARVFQFFDLIFLTCLGEYRTAWLRDLQFIWTETRSSLQI